MTCETRGLLPGTAAAVAALQSTEAVKLLLDLDTSELDIDTQVVLVIDASNDVGERGPFDGQASSLDRSVRAAS